MRQFLVAGKSIGATACSCVFFLSESLITNMPIMGIEKNLQNRSIFNNPESLAFVLELHLRDPLFLDASKKDFQLFSFKTIEKQ